MKNKTKAQRAAKKRRNEWRREVALRSIEDQATAERGFSTHRVTLKKVFRYHTDTLPQYILLEAERMIAEGTAQ